MAQTQPQHSGPAPEFQLKHRLALALEVAGVERDEMAAELGAHKNTIGNYLRGETRPGRAVLRVWALRCGVPFTWLETGVAPGDFGPDQDTHVARCIRGPWGAQPTGDLDVAA